MKKIFKFDKSVLDDKELFESTFKEKLIDELGITITIGYDFGTDDVISVVVDVPETKSSKPLKDQSYHQKRIADAAVLANDIELAKMGIKYWYEDDKTFYYHK